MFLADDVFELCIVPPFHAIFLLLVCATSVGIHVLLGRFPFDGKIMREFTFIASFTFSLFKVYAPQD
jgi:hypothetical protein